MNPRQRLLYRIADHHWRFNLKLGIAIFVLSIIVMISERVQSSPYSFKLLAGALMLAAAVSVLVRALRFSARADENTYGTGWFERWFVRRWLRKNRNVAGAADLVDITR